MVQDLGKRLRLISVTATWLLKNRPPHPCVGDDPEDGIDINRDAYQALAEAIVTARDRFVVVDVRNSAGDLGSSGDLVSVIEVEKSNQVDPQNSSAVHSKGVFRMWVPKR